MSGFAANCWRLGRAGRNSARKLIIEQPLRGLAMLFVLAVVWTLLGGLFWSVLHFLGQENYRAFKERLVETLLGVFTFALFFLVLISDLVVVWASLFRSRSAVHLAQSPVSDRGLYWTAALEGCLWSSWAVVVLALPLVATLASEAAQPWRFVPAAVLALAAFIACAVMLGGLGALALARLIPLLRKGLPGIIALVVVGLVLGLLFTGPWFDARRQPLTMAQEVVGKLSFTAHPLLPSAWVQQCLISAKNAAWNDYLHHLLLLVTTAGALGVAAETWAHRRLRRELDAITGRPEVRARTRSKAWRPLPLLPADLALLVAKDLRLFVRDPAQVLQFTMFFGLLGFYLLMLPRLGKAFLFDDAWRPAVALLNLIAIAMALSTFTGRFVYPLLSLEGRRLWVLALAPFPRHRVVTAKLAFALLVGLPVSVGLVSLSGLMLALPLLTIVFQSVVMAAMACGLAAGALGIGARFADYAEDNPGKLVAGYGGNINLLASLTFAALLAAGAALPVLMPHEALAWFGGLAWSLVIAGTWTGLFLRMAWRHFA